MNHTIEIYYIQAGSLDIDNYTVYHRYGDFYLDKDHVIKEVDRLNAEIAAKRKLGRYHYEEDYSWSEADLHFDAFPKNWFQTG